MELQHLENVEKTIGAKQTAKALARGELMTVFVASDCDDNVIQEVLDLCQRYDVTYNREYSMEALGKASHIKVKAAAVGVRK